jgi:hypothetical protein
VIRDDECAVRRGLNPEEFFRVRATQTGNGESERGLNGFRGRQVLDLAKQFVIVQSPAQLIDNLVGRNEVIRQTF